MTPNNKQDKAAIAMAAATAWLDQNGFGFEYIPPHQIKIGPLNFWPGSGTITFDGEDQKRPEKGLEGLAAALGSDQMHGYLRHYRRTPDDVVRVNPFAEKERVGFTPK
jgi:hypothetical protein